MRTFHVALTIAFLLGCSSKAAQKIDDVSQPAAAEPERAEPEAEQPAETVAPAESEPGGIGEPVEYQPEGASPGGAPQIEGISESTSRPEDRCESDSDCSHLKLLCPCRTYCDQQTKTCKVERLKMEIVKPIRKLE